MKLRIHNQGLSGGEGARMKMTMLFRNPKNKRATGATIAGILVDTGADKSGIPEEMVAELQKRIGPLDIREVPIHGAGGLTTLKSLRDIEVCAVTQEGGNPCCTTTDLIAIPRLQAAFLLGRDLLGKCGAQIDFTKKAICFSGGSCRKMEGL